MVLIHHAVGESQRHDELLASILLVEEEVIFYAVAFEEVTFPSDWFGVLKAVPAFDKAAGARVVQLGLANFIRKGLDGYLA